VAKDPTEGKPPDATTSKFLRFGRGLTRSSFRNGMWAPRSVANLLAIPINDSLAVSDGSLFALRSTKTGADFDLSRNTAVRRSFSNVRWDQRRGEEMRVERQK
jgi:hypothetical protein